jgi:pimeloyl-ACP methyl ester carboxylesterase
MGSSISQAGRGIVELVLLHAMPLDGSMWRHQAELLPGATYAPTLYGFGESLAEWAAAVLDHVQGERLIIAGNSIGGSCAIEMAALAPERIAAVAMIGAKAGHRPQPDLHREAISLLRGEGVEAGWDRYWGPLFGPGSAEAMADAKRIALALSVDDVAAGVTAFHTRADRSEVVPTLRCPIHFISGDHDVAPDLSTIAARVNEARDGRLTIIPECGHYVPLEQPEALNAILRSLIAELS